MSTLQAALDDYLALRRALGFELRLAGRLLQRFVDFAQAANATYITTELALLWATQPKEAQPAQWADRLGMVRRFAQYCASIDPRTVVPPPDLLPYRLARPTPYIYRDEQISQLIQAARALPPQTGLRPHTYSTLFALYAVTGMRTQEPLRLDRDDVDLANGVLTVRGTNGSSVPPSTTRRCWPGCSTTTCSTTAGPTRPT
jgi:integrase